MRTHALVKHLTCVSMLQARLSFTHIGGPQPGRRGAMDAGDADGADALLSLAKLANAESSGMMDDDVSFQHDSYADHIDTPSIIARPRRAARAPPKADVSSTHLRHTLQCLDYPSPKSCTGLCMIE